jgi:hypothetical protein
MKKDSQIGCLFVLYTPCAWVYLFLSKLISSLFRFKLIKF